MLKILVSNDDGIQAMGIKHLVEALSRKAEVYVSAPHEQRSASGHSITIGKPIGIREVDFENAVMAIECTGTPADCVKIGTKYYAQKGIEFDLVYSGINHGGNLGTDTLYSGTVSAAVEGVLCKIPSVAVSVNSHNPKYFQGVKDLIIESLDPISKNLKRDTALNINVPNLPKEQIKGLRYTCLGIREYEEWFKPGTNGEGEEEFYYEGTPRIYKSKNLEYDVIAMQEGYASISPLHFDLTNHDLIEEVESWGILKGEKNE